MSGLSIKVIMQVTTPEHIALMKLIHRETKQSQRKSKLASRMTLFSDCLDEGSPHLTPYKASYVIPFVERVIKGWLI